MGDAPARLRLFLSGTGPRADALEQAVRRAGDQHYGAGGWTLEVVDARSPASSAREVGVFLTPALHRVSPGPELRWFGDLSDAESLRRAFADVHV